MANAVSKPCSPGCVTGEDASAVSAGWRTAQCTYASEASNALCSSVTWRTTSASCGQNWEVVEPRMVKPPMPSARPGNKCLSRPTLSSRPVCPQRCLPACHSPAAQFHTEKGGTTNSLSSTRFLAPFRAAGHASSAAARRASAACSSRRKRRKRGSASALEVARSCTSASTCAASEASASASASAAAGASRLDNGLEEGRAESRACPAGSAVASSSEDAVSLAPPRPRPLPESSAAATGLRVAGAASAWRASARLSARLMPCARDTLRQFSATAVCRPGARTASDAVPGSSARAVLDTQSKNRCPSSCSVSASTASRMCCPAL